MQQTLTFTIDKAADHETEERDRQVIVVNTDLQRMRENSSGSKRSKCEGMIALQGRLPPISFWAACHDVDKGHMLGYNIAK